MRTVAALRMLALVALAPLTGCGAEAYVVRGAPAAPYDAVIVPGCPTEDDGRLSLCLIGRAAWAAEIWARGWTGAFIVSGGAVHSPAFEAEALARALTVLGVPPDRIHLEPHALHTDENVYYSLQIARARGFRRLAVASQGGHAAWACRMLDGWGQACEALPLELAATRRRADASRAALLALRVPRVRDWQPMAVQEHARRLATGAAPRPPSFILYPGLAFLKASGEPYAPPLPRTPLVTWGSLRSAPSARKTAVLDSIGRESVAARAPFGL